LPLLDGEVSVGVYGKTPNQSGVIFVHSSDPRKLLDLLVRKANVPVPSDTYRGHPVSVGTGTQSGTMAVDQGWLVVGTDRSSLEQALDRIDASPTSTLATNQRYVHVVGRLPSGKLGFIYLDGQALASAEPDWISPQVQTFIGNFEWTAAVSVAARRDGFDLDGESAPDQARVSATRPPDGDTTAAFRALPANTVAAIGGSNAPWLLQGTDETLTSLVEQSAPAGQSRASGGGLHYTRWLGGEFALGLGRDESQTTTALAGTGTSWVAVAKVKDSAAAEADLDWLDSYVAPGRQPTFTTLAGSQFRRIPNSSLPIVYGIANNLLYVIHSTDPTGVIQGNGDQGLLANPRYRFVASAMSPHGIDVFIDGDALRAWVDVQAPSGHTDDIQFDGLPIRPVVTPIHAFGGNIRTDADGSTHGRFILSVSKLGNGER
ncbi:MAG: DUF3352 domain-containing protein, partial [Candidatus Dormibacteraceae bacterium]